MCLCEKTVTEAALQCPQPTGSLIEGGGQRPGLQFCVCFDICQPFSTQNLIEKTTGFTLQPTAVVDTLLPPSLRSKVLLCDLCLEFCFQIHFSYTN